MIKCDKCGDCCRSLTLPLSISLIDDQIRWVEYHTGAEIKNGRFVKLDLPCSKLKDNKCTIYENRPACCRDYECKKIKIGS